jgi:hypothetical protein
MLYMKKFAGLLALLLFFAAAVVAQDQPQDTAPVQAPPAAPAPAKAPEKAPPPKPKHGGYESKYEISADFTHYSFYAASGTTPSMNGWTGSFVYNYKWWLGLEGEGLGVYNHAGNLEGNTTIYSGFVGPQIYPLGHRRITVFAHAMFGGGRYQLSFPPFSPFAASAVVNTGAGWEVGGGADFYVRKHLAVRVFQLDYDKIGFFSGKASRGNARISVGIVYRFGDK